MTTEPEAKRVETAAGRVSYREAGAGEGKPVILALHGLGGNSRTWKAQYADLSDAFHIIGWDAPGYGETMVVGPDQTAYNVLALALANLVFHLAVLQWLVLLPPQSALHAALGLLVLMQSVMAGRVIPGFTISAARGTLRIAPLPWLDKACLGATAVGLASWVAAPPAWSAWRSG